MAWAAWIRGGREFRILKVGYPELGTGNAAAQLEFGIRISKCVMWLCEFLMLREQVANDSNIAGFGRSLRGPGSKGLLCAYCGSSSTPATDKLVCVMFSSHDSSTLLAIGKKVLLMMVDFIWILVAILTGQGFSSVIVLMYEVSEFPNHLPFFLNVTVLITGCSSRFINRWSHRYNPRLSSSFAPRSNSKVPKHRSVACGLILWIKHNIIMRCS